MNHVLITGYNGFVGEELVKLVSKTTSNIILLGRKPNTDFECHNVDFESRFDVRSIMENVDVVFHCAARAHIMNDSELDPLSCYRRVNTASTLALAEQAAAAGVKRFIFLSSIKVNGEVTGDDKPFTESVESVPADPYGLSKYEAEKGLLEIAKISDMEVVIIRPPLVYGPKVKGNFATLIKLAKTKLPIPLGSVKHNKRSLVALDNLVDFIVLCGDYNRSPMAANEVFLISDGEDISTADLIKKISQACGKRSLLLPIPISFLKCIAALVGKTNLADRVLSSLQVDSSKAQDLLDWKPVVTIESQLRKIFE